ncbi:uncharacterized protein MONBRDRAFT_5272 [Monosiga brevicollis MX1]|uniref:Uncharacterized protein n=1 Tax=Monosiga brevicollis TaxID=81824 RepID=A9UQG6_MONBE|nr:uncharacterized protein MONBRDRAFT_5272 [Monosiga brevicollis MX1]EDQ92595.1 predicted protein [Monosiga brevicollis MX1]|eukprot:XP_001742357.1 hypothetical protein [Monosiga brevicollis MX1]
MHNYSLDDAVNIVFHQDNDTATLEVLACSDPYAIFTYGAWRQALAICSGYAPLNYSATGQYYTPIGLAFATRYAPQPYMEDLSRAYVSASWSRVSTELPADALYQPVQNVEMGAVLPVAMNANTDLPKYYIDVVRSPGLTFIISVRQSMATTLGAIISPEIVYLLVLTLVVGIVVGTLVYAAEWASVALKAYHTTDINYSLTFPNGFLWTIFYAFMVMLAVFYDERHPRAIASRVLLMVWKWATWLLVGLVNARLLLYLQPPSSIRSDQELSTLTVAVLENTIEDYRVGIRGAMVKVFNSTDAAIRALLADEVDAFAVDTVVSGSILTYAANLGHSVKTNGYLLSDILHGVLVSAEVADLPGLNLRSNTSNTTLLQCVEESMVVIRPTIEEQIAAWVGHSNHSANAAEGSSGYGADNPLIITGGILVIGLWLLAALWNLPPALRCYHRGEYDDSDNESVPLASSHRSVTVNDVRL